MESIAALPIQVPALEEPLLGFGSDLLCVAADTFLERTVRNQVREDDLRNGCN